MCLLSIVFEKAQRNFKIYVQILKKQIGNDSVNFKMKAYVSK